VLKHLRQLCTLRFELFNLSCENKVDESRFVVALIINGTAVSGDEKSQMSLTRRQVLVHLLGRTFADALDLGLVLSESLGNEREATKLT
jgi:hypothetical protein